MQQDIYPEIIASNQWSKGKQREFWGNNLPIRFYGDVHERPHALKTFYEAFESIPIEEILDAGSGEGYLSFPLANKGFKVLGVDSSKGMNEKSDKELDSNVRFEFGDITDLTNLNIKPNSFSGCICVGVLLHLNQNEVKLALKSIVETLKPNSPILISVPHEYLANPKSPTTNNKSGVVDFKLINIHKSTLNTSSQTYLCWEMRETYYHSLNFEPLNVTCFIHENIFIRDLLLDLDCEIAHTTDLYFRPKDLDISQNWAGDKVNHPFYYQILAFKK